MKVIRWLDEHLEETILIVLLVLITCISMVQILARTFAQSLPWPEEFCRLCWIWTVFLSLPYTIRKSNMLRVSVLADLLPTKARNTLNIIIDLVIAVCMAIFFSEAINVVANMLEKGRVSAALQIPMGLLYSVTLLGFGLGVLRALQQCYFHVKNFNKKEMTTLEATIAEAAEEAAAASGDLEGGNG